MGAFFLSMPAKPKTTIKDVAQASGYSTYTVSSVLNNKGDIGQAASEKIRSIARGLNYGILGTAPAQRRMTAQCLGIVLPEANCLHVGFYNRAMSSFRDIASRHDYDCKVFTEGDIAKRTDPKRSGGPGIFGCKGLAFFCPWGDYRAYLKPLLSQGVSVALIRRKGPRAKGLMQIRDNVPDSMKQLLNYLHDQCGSRRIAYVGHPRQRHPQLQDWGIAFNEFAREKLVPEGNLILWEEATNRTALYQRLTEFVRADASKRPAICTWSDPCAARILSHLQQQSLRVPEDVMVCGYNDDPIALDTTPALTTVHIPIEEMIEQAFDYLLTYREEGQLPPAKSITLAHKLVARDSTREQVPQTQSFGPQSLIMPSPDC